MKATSLLTLGALALGVSSSVAQQPATVVAPPVEAVQVTFLVPEDYTDFRDSYFSTESGTEHLMSEIRRHVVRTATPLLAPGQRLEVRFLDIDLAGDYEPWRGPHFDDIRIVKDLYAPRMDVEFRLVNADGTVASEGVRKLHNMAFLMTRANDPLRHDKDLLSDWIRREFRRAKRS
jgi:hypothetical protein